MTKKWSSVKSDLTKTKRQASKERRQRMHIAIGDLGSDRCRVFLDGEERTKVIEADEEGRYLVRYRTDEKGDAILNADGSDVLRECMHGDVRIDLHPDDEWIRRRLAPNYGGI
jgi:hypothetical protein